MKIIQVVLLVLQLLLAIKWNEIILKADLICDFFLCRSNRFDTMGGTGSTQRWRRRGEAKGRQGRGADGKGNGWKVRHLGHLRTEYQVFNFMAQCI